VCSADASVTLETLKSGSTDYVFFCGVAGLEATLSPAERISPLDFRKKHPKEVLQDGDSISKEPTIIDVREKVQFDICNLENSINIPISTILSSAASPTTNADANAQPSLPSWLPADVAPADSTDPIYVVCRLGNDSQIAVRRLKELGLDLGGQRYIGDIQGGLRAWREQIDPDWPEY
jgi:adenylyltransferase/sulfurtransferase